MALLIVYQTYEHVALGYVPDLSNIEGMRLNLLPLDAQHMSSHLTTRIIQELLRICGGTFNDIDAMAVTVGPASFTGLRVVLSALQGIARVRTPHVLTCTLLSLQAFRAKFCDPAIEKFTSVIENNRNGYFVQDFSYASESPYTQDMPVSLQEASVSAVLPDQLRDHPWIRTPPEDAAAFMPLYFGAASLALECSASATHDRIIDLTDHTRPSPLMPFYGTVPSFKKRSPLS